MLRFPATRVHVAFRALLATLLLLTAGAVAFAADGRLLFQGENRLGIVPDMKMGKSAYLSVSAMARLLGCDVTEKNDTLLLQIDRDRLQIVEGATAVWLNVELLPMAGPAVRGGGAWWLEERSALKVFSRLLRGAGKESALSFRAGDDQPDVESVRPPAGKDAAAPAKRDVVRPAPEQKSSSLPLLRGIRWGRPEGKIRAVLEYSGETPPAVEGTGSALRFVFGTPIPGEIAATGTPYPDAIRLSVTNFGDRNIVELASNGAKTETFTLGGPARLVVDFTLPDGAKKPEARDGKAASRPEQETKKTESDIREEKTQPDSSSGERRPSGKRRAGKYIVAVDPGHGGKDPGAISNGIREKDVNLKIASHLAGELCAMGIDARMTRTGDTYLRLQERTELANRWKADMFVSIHANALPAGHHALGMEIYLMALPTDKDAMRLALIENRDLAADNDKKESAASDRRTQLLLSILGNMQQNAKISESTTVAERLFGAGKQGGLPMRRVAQAPFFVLRGATMPAVLVETGFLTEAREAKMLATPEYQKKCASALAGGVVSYLENQ